MQKSHTAGFGKDLLLTARSFWQGRVGADMYVPEGHSLMEAPHCMLLVRATRPKLWNSTKLSKLLQFNYISPDYIYALSRCLELELFGAG